mmetsp:Transcript_66802/g.92941  ORF Transcript_66802/g.92941 Transcript_66802/m.92941 type:complete len:393 (+) Transcript_66802:231-1409(+)
MSVSSSSVLFSFCLALLCLSAAVSASAGEERVCGVVRDGLSGHLDMDVQLSNSTIGANWSGFGDSVILVEWAIVSSAQRLPSADLGERCYSDMRVVADVQPWTRLAKTATSAASTALSLQVGETYVVLVRATFRSGVQVTVASNGVRVMSHEEAERLMPRVARTEEVERDHQSEVPPSANCPIDNENRCRQSIESVGDFLENIYGPAEFAIQQSVNGDVFLVGSNANRAAAGLNSREQAAEDEANPDDDDGDDDDDDNGKPWILGIVFGLVFLLALLLLALLILRLAGGGLPEREPREKKPKKENVDLGEFADPLERKDYGMREGVGAGDATTETRVEFPDTQIRRLSITHDEGAAAAAAAGAAEESKSPRRKHPIMSSASSSFRDYRSVAK